MFIDGSSTPSIEMTFDGATVSTWNRADAVTAVRVPQADWRNARAIPFGSPGTNWVRLNGVTSTVDVEVDGSGNSQSSGPILASVTFRKP